MAVNLSLSIAMTPWGFPAIWEEGGESWNRRGEAYIVTDQNGMSCFPILVQQGNAHICDKHALLMVWPGYYLIHVTTQRSDYMVTIVKLKNFLLPRKDQQVANRMVARVELIGCFDNWTFTPQRNVPKKLSMAVEAAIRKAQMPDCNTPFFIKSSSDAARDDVSDSSSNRNKGQ